MEAETMVQILEKETYRIGENGYAAASEKIQVMIVDKHVLMREALYRVVSTFPEVQICASLGSLKDATQVAQKTRAQVIILSSSIAVSECLDLIKLFSEGQPS